MTRRRWEAKFPSPVIFILRAISDEGNEQFSFAHLNNKRQQANRNRADLISQKKAVSLSAKGLFATVVGRGDSF